MVTYITPKWCSLLYGLFKPNERSTGLCDPSERKIFMIRSARIDRISLRAKLQYTAPFLKGFSCSGAMASQLGRLWSRGATQTYTFLVLLNGNATVEPRSHFSSTASEVALYSSVAPIRCISGHKCMIENDVSKMSCDRLFEFNGPHI